MSSDEWFEKRYTKEAIQSGARRIGEELPDDLLADKPLDFFVKRLVKTRLQLVPIKLDTDDKHYKHQDSTIIITYPFAGGYMDLVAFFREISPMMRSSAEGRYLDVPLDTSLLPANQVTEAIKDAVAWTDNYVRQQVLLINANIQEDQKTFETELFSILRPRWERVSALREAMQELNIPLGEVQKNRIDIPVKPTELSMATIQDTATKSSSGWRLAEQMAEALIETIASFSRALERLPKTASSWLEQDEEALRDLLLFVLNANFKGRVTGETFIGQGKSDILLRWEDRDAFIGECKIWRGPKTVSDGLNQLLDRYALWRHSHIALIVFIKSARDASKAINSAYQAILEHPRTKRALDNDERSERSDFEVLASGDEKRLAQLSLLPVVIPES